MVCIFFLNINGIPSHLRYLLRRVRQCLPHALIVVGLWSESDTHQWSEDLQSALGADCYATSVRDRVSACLASTDLASAIGPAPQPGGVAT
jgi:hypothetical protein